MINFQLEEDSFEEHIAGNLTIFGFFKFFNVMIIIVGFLIASTGFYLYLVTLNFTLIMLYIFTLGVGTIILGLYGFQAKTDLQILSRYIYFISMIFVCCMFTALNLMYFEESLLEMALSGTDEETKEKIDEAIQAHIVFSKHFLLISVMLVGLCLFLGLWYQKSLKDNKNDLSVFLLRKNEKEKNKLERELQVIKKRNLKIRTRVETQLENLKIAEETKELNMKIQAKVEKELRGIRQRKKKDTQRRRILDHLEDEVENIKIQEKNSQLDFHIGSNELSRPVNKTKEREQLSPHRIDATQEMPQVHHEEVKNQKEHLEDEESSSQS